VRTIAVVTGARSDYGIYLPLLRKLVEDGDVALRLMVTGMHLSPEFGLTADAIVADGFSIDERVDCLEPSGDAEGTARSIGLGIVGFAQAFGRFRPDLVVVLGDRFEMYAAAVAALPFRIPVAHIHGGELSEGAIDDALRHSMTKLSHLHFVATEEYARRVVQLGEEPWRVHMVGALSLDNLGQMELMTRPQLETLVDLPLQDPPVLVTMHPATLEPMDPVAQLRELLAALDDVPGPLVFTAPNADADGKRIRVAVADYAGTRRDARLVENLGTGGYFGMMSIARAMVGNSSSGIIEAASFRLPVVNIGDRQRGRIRGANVVDVPCERAEILQALRAATSAAFRARLAELTNPYGEGRAAPAILRVLKEVPLDNELVMKRFHDQPPVERACLEAT
jgi:UDP-hydrolysing UDP-N-acetyl-D-glucosamine 2-epimerase